MTYGDGAYGDTPAYNTGPLDRSVSDLSAHAAAAIDEIRRLEAERDYLRDEVDYLQDRLSDAEDELIETKAKARTFAEDLMKEALAHNATRATFEQQRTDDRLTIADLQQRLTDCESGPGVDID